MNTIMQSTSLTNQSASKEQLLNELRVRYETKYGNDQEVRETIREQLEKIKAKPRLSLTDLNDIDTRISQASKCSLSKSIAHSHQRSSSSLLKDHFISSGYPFRLPVIESSTSRDKKLPELQLQTDKFSEKGLEKQNEGNPRRLSKISSLSSYSIQNLKISKHSFDLTPFNPKMLNQSAVKLEKTNQYNYNRNKEIWGLLTAFQLKKESEKEHQRELAKSNLKKSFAADLGEQVAMQKTRQNTEKTELNKIDHETIQKDLLLSEELEKKKRRHRLEIIRRSKQYFDEAIEEKTKRNELKESLTKKDAEKMQAIMSQTGKVDADNKEKRRLKQQELYLENLKLQNIKTKEREEEREKDRALEKSMIEYQIEARDKLDDEVNNFYKSIRLRATRQAEPSPGRGFDNLRNYGRIETEKSPSKGFMDSPTKAEEDDTKEKKKELLSKIYDLQIQEKAAREKEYQEVLKDQARIWKEDRDKFEEEQANIQKREKKAKEVLRLSLDQQLQEKEARKKILYDPSELWVNRRLLRQMGYQSSLGLGIQYKKIP